MGLLGSVLAGALGLAFLYRGFWFSGGELLQGDPGDGRLTAFIATHWLDPLRWGSWTDLGMFYPVTETIGYSDWLFVHGMLTWPFAVSGLSPEVAFQWALITLSAIGYAGMVTLLRAGPGVPWVWAIAGGFVFAFGNGVQVAGSHPQLAPVMLLPVIALALLASWRSIHAVGRWLWAASAGAVTGLLVVSAFYIFFFLMLLVAIGVMIILLWPAMRRMVTADPRRLMTVVSGSILGVLPFVVWSAPVYLRALAIGGGQRSDADILYWSLSPKDYINVTNSNAVWGWLIDRIYPADQLWRAQPSEWGYAPTPAVWILVLLAIIAGWHMRRRWQTWDRIGMAALGTGIILEFLLLRIGPVFPWTLIAQLPGATAIRALGRLQLVAALVLIVGITILLSRWVRIASTERRWVTPLAAAVLVFVCFEQVNLAPPQTNGPDRRMMLNSISAPPFECATFVVLQPTKPDDLSPTTQIDAMIVSRNIGIPSMHGYTGIEPPGWNLKNSWESDYRARIRDRISQFDAAAVTCGIDLSTGAWSSPEALQVALG